MSEERYTVVENGLAGRVFGRSTAWEIGDPERNVGLALVATRETADLLASAPAMLSLIRRMAERCDRSINGVCRLCMVRRPKGGWWFTDDWQLMEPAPTCPNDKCLSHEIRSILLNAER
jgi:hypothetical protein